MKILNWIRKHLDPVKNDQWTKEKEVKMITMDTNGKLKVVTHTYEK